MGIYNVPSKNVDIKFSVTTIVDQWNEKLKNTTL